MELLLWRWSTMVQATSNLIIAVFFVALALSLRRRELRAWMIAWLMNLGALSVTIIYWLWQPQSHAVMAVASAGYVFCKSMFVVFLIDGIGSFEGRLSDRRTILSLFGIGAVFACVIGYINHSIQLLGAIIETVIVLGLGAGFVYALRFGTRYAWIATGFALRALLSLASIYAYGEEWLRSAPDPGSALSIYVASHSSFDTGAEWIIALGCLLVAYRLIQDELTLSNAELRRAQSQMRQMLNRDQLTGVYNRRALPTMMREARRTGATVLFFDLDDFKKINDAQGHHAGDASLARFARALQESFRTGDRVIRYAGDEFIVVADDMDPDAVAMRVDEVRRKVCAGDASLPALEFSVGQALLAPDGDPDEALRAADRAMYDAKGVGRARPEGQA